MALRASELAALEGLLTGVSSLPGRGGVNASDIEDSLRLLINDPDFADELLSRVSRSDYDALGADLKKASAKAQGRKATIGRMTGDLRKASAKAEGRKATIGRMAEDMKGLRGDLRKASAKAAGRGETIRRLQAAQKASGGGPLSGLGGFGKGALAIGGGIAGTFMLLEFLKMLKDSGGSKGLAEARMRAPSEYAESMQLVNSPRMMDRIRSSQELRTLAESDPQARMPMSRELQDAITMDPREIYRYRQQMKAPSLREAYARAGLMT